MSAYTRQKAKSKYRNRIRLERASQEQSSDTHKTPYDRVKRCRERKKMKASERINDGASTSAAGAAEPMQVHDVIASVSTPGCIDIDVSCMPFVSYFSYHRPIINKIITHKLFLYFISFLNPTKGKCCHHKLKHGDPKDVLLLRNDYDIHIIR